MKKSSMSRSHLVLESPDSNFFGGLMNFFTVLNKARRSKKVQINLSIDDFEIIEGNQVSGISPESKLLEGAREGKIEWVKELIAQGVTIDYSDEEGNTALIEAVRTGNDELVKLLLRHNVDIYAKTNGGSSALSIARENDFIVIQKILMNKMVNPENEGDAFLVRPYI